jgi:hypothetical protein
MNNMTLVERVEKSEVFSRLEKEELAVVVQALEAGNKQVIEETESILGQESGINRLFDRSIEALTEDAVKRIRKRFDERGRLRLAKQQEEAEKTQDIVEAESELDSSDT